MDLVRPLAPLLEPIRRCHQHDPAAFVPLQVAGRPVGRLAKGVRGPLLAECPALQDAGEAVHLPDPHRADEVVQALIDLGLIRGRRGEAYPIVERWGAPLLGRIDRAAVAMLGLPSFGLHVNGLVRRGEDRVAMWLATRAADRMVAPGKLDNMVAGGQPADLSLADNLLKEAREEAGMSPLMAARARPVGVIGYSCATGALDDGLRPGGLRRDALFVYDLWLDEDFIPVNEDGEVAGFELLDLEEVASILRDDPGRFKFNVPAVVIDCLLRLGRLDPDDPDFPALVTALRGNGPI